MQGRDLPYVDEAVEAFLRVALIRPPVGVINIGHGVQHAIRDVAEGIASLTGTRAKLRIGSRPARAQDLQDFVTRVDRAATTLQWRPIVPIHGGLLHTINWHRQHHKLNATGPS